VIYVEPMFRENFELTNDNPNFSIINWLFIEIIWLFLEFSLKKENILKKNELAISLKVPHFNLFFLPNSIASFVTTSSLVQFL
jgi:hypothetical protein